jgi:fermentation-respiration switch protein FrsA (DUF1100 family)
MCGGVTMLSPATAATNAVVDAPSLAEGDFGWWHGNFPTSSGNYRGWDRTRDWALRLFAREHFDGVFGFSQGAAMAGVLAGMRSADGASFDFAIMVGGFRSEMPAHQDLYAATDTYALPSLHIMGTSDSIVPAADFTSAGSTVQVTDHRRTPGRPRHSRHTHRPRHGGGVSP